MITASGSIDVYRIARADLHSYQMYTAEELFLAEWVREHTDAHTVWLTSDKHNHWLYNLTGRQTLMAYRGWLWTHGYDYTSIEADIAKMFQRPNENRTLFEKYQVEYIVLGPDERRSWRANQSAHQSLFTPVQETQHYVILTTQ